MGREAGFTLIELLVVIAIVAILLTVGVPSFTSLIKRERLKGVVETFSSDMRRVRSEAIARGPADRLLVEFTPGSNWSYTVTDVTGVAVLSRSGADFDSTISLSVPAGAFGNADGDGLRDLTVSALRALATDGSGSVTFSDGTNSVQVSRNLLGRWDICSGQNFMGYTPC